MDDGFVNLETSLAAARRSFRDGSCGRHRLSASSTGNSYFLGDEFTSPDAIARYIVSKGIAINGVSLTVADYDSALSWFKVTLTYAETNRYLRPGSLVNLEGDILGKYIEKFILDPAAIPPIMTVQMS